MKRKEDESSGLQSTKRQCKPLQETKSLQERAQPYLLGTAKLPLKVLTTTWKNAPNRRLDRQHVSDLCHAFEKGTLARATEANYLLVSCSAKAFEDMKNHLNHEEMQDSLASNAADGKVTSFWDWAKVNDERLEVMAGQHRIAALKQYVEQKSSPPEELWWTCSIYNKDTLPLTLSNQLRMNRRELLLPDNHGQIWMQLVYASREDESLFRGRKSDVEREMLDVLCLGDSPKFPISRLITLWNNQRWKSMITRWCETAVGRGLFNISTWECMASRRIDDYWFTKFDQVVERLHELPGDALKEVEARDWKRLANLTPEGQIKAHATGVSREFYPGKAYQDAGVSENAGGRRRRANFLMQLDDKGYRAFCNFLIQRPSLSFPEVHTLLETSKEQGPVMMKVMIHVVLWIDRKSGVVSDKRKSNKLLLRQGLVSRLQSGDDGDDGRARAEKQSIQLERQILDFVRNRMKDLQHPTTNAFLETMPAEDDEAGHEYSERFADKFWKDLLYIVTVFLGPRFQPWWQKPGAAESLSSSPDHQTAHSTITRALCTLAHRIPEVADNPSLNSKEALNELASAIDKAVVQWASRPSQQAPEGNGAGPRETISSRTRQVIESAKTRDSMVNEAGSDASPVAGEPPDDPTRPTRPTLSLPSSLGSTALSETSVIRGSEDAAESPPIPRREGVSRHDRDETRVADTEQQKEDAPNPNSHTSLEESSSRAWGSQTQDGGARPTLSATRDQQQPRTESSRQGTRSDADRPRKPLPSSSSSPLAVSRRTGARKAGASWRDRPMATSSAS